MSIVWEMSTRKKKREHPSKFKSERGRTGSFHGCSKTTCGAEGTLRSIAMTLRRASVWERSIPNTFKKRVMRKHAITLCATCTRCTDGVPTAAANSAQVLGSRRFLGPVFFDISWPAKLRTTHSPCSGLQHGRAFASALLLRAILLQVLPCKALTAFLLNPPWAWRARRCSWWHWSSPTLTRAQKCIPRTSFQAQEEIGECAMQSARATISGTSTFTRP